jgi:hypothetical protein
MKAKKSKRSALKSKSLNAMAKRPNGQESVKKNNKSNWANTKTVYVRPR